MAPSGGIGQAGNHLAAARGELQPIADQVGQQLHDPLAIESDDHRRRGHLDRQRHASLLGEFGVRLDHRTDRVAQIAGPHVEREDAGVDARQIEQVGAHPIESADLLLGARQEFAAGRLIDVAVTLQLGECAQGGDRRAKLVRHVRHEFAEPVPVGLEEP